MAEDIDFTQRVTRPKPTQSVDPAVIYRVRRTAVLLGPYRNLTTLTASVLALHPQCQVLNHAGARLLRRGAFDFISSPDEATWRKFVAMALRASTGGRRGWYGGTILYAHAFGAEGQLQRAYRDRYGASRLKSDPRCLVWKDSMRVQQRFMDVPGAFEAVLANLPEVLFLAPIRKPLDVVVSSMTATHAALMWPKPNPSFSEVVELVLTAFQWILAQQARFPDRVFVFRQTEIGEELFIRLARFLGVEPDPQWLEDAKRCFVVRERTHTQEVREAFRKAADPVLTRCPELASLCR